jgi:hypothetical protein
MNNEKKPSYYDGPASLAPVPLHVASAVIRPMDKGKTKAIALETIEKQTNQQIAMLKRQADLLMKQVREIEERVRIAAEIYKADMGFEPVINHTYHLYDSEKGRKLSMVAPDEWGRSVRRMTFVASVRLNADRTWDVVQVNENTATEYITEAEIHSETAV